MFPPFWVIVPLLDFKRLEIFTVPELIERPELLSKTRFEILSIPDPTSGVSPKVKEFDTGW